MRCHVLFVLACCLVIASEARRGRRWNFAGMFKKSVGYKFLVNDTIRETYTLTSLKHMNMFSMLSVVPYHSKISIGSLFLNKESPYTYTRVSAGFEDCNITEPATYVPKEGEFIIIEENPSGSLVDCPNRIDMVLEWDIQMSLANSDPFDADVKGDLHVSTVEKPLFSVMQDLQTQNKFKFGYKMFTGLGAFVNMVDDVVPPIGAGETYSQYSFFLMRRMLDNFSEMCGLTYGVSTYQPIDGDHIVIVIKKWAGFVYVACNETRDQH